jgi:hypothetical protein
MAIDLEERKEENGRISFAKGSKGLAPCMHAPAQCTATSSPAGPPPPPASY